MNLDDVLIFTEVVNHGSFTAAAETLAMPKSNVSRSVTRLEKALGVKLLERTTRRLALTEIGRVYHVHGTHIKEELDAANASIEKMTATPRGNLRVSASVTVGQSLIPAQIAEFSQKYLEVKLDLLLTNRRVDLLEEGFDVVIRVGRLDDSNLIARKLCTQKLCLYASPGYLKSSNRSLAKPEDLNGHSCLYMNATSKRAKWQLQSGTGEYLFEFKPQITCDNFNAIHQLAVNGAGIALLPDYLCTDHVMDGKLLLVLDGWTGGDVDFYTIVPSRRGITPKVRAFLDHMHSKCADS